MLYADRNVGERERLGTVGVGACDAIGEPALPGDATIGSGSDKMRGASVRRLAHRSPTMVLHGTAFVLAGLALLSNIAAPSSYGAGSPRWFGGCGRSLPLMVDSLYAATFLGGIAEDGYRDVSVVLEPGGTVLVAGSSRSADFPTTAGAYDESHNGGCDVFVARFDGRLSTLLAATFVGGSGDDGAWPGVGLAEDSSGRIYVTGTTTSSTLPVTPGAYDLTYNGGGDVFVASFSYGLDSLLACTYLGGSAGDNDVHLVLGGSNDLYIEGYTASGNFPTTVGAFDRTRGGATDVFVTRLSRDLATLMASTYLGGSSDEFGPGVLWDPGGYVYVAGITNTYGFPTTPGAYDRQVNTNPGDVDVFLSKFSADLSTLVASTFVGGSKTDFPYALARGTTGDIFVAGHVQSQDYPTTPSAFDRTYNSAPGDYDDVFVSRLSPALTQLVASTYLGGSGWDWAIAMASDGGGHLFVGGETQSSNFPTTPGALAETMHGVPPNQEGFVSRLDEDLTTLESSTYLGGGGNDLVSRIVVGPAGNLVVTGGTGSSDFLMTPASYDTTFGGGANRWGGDVVLVRLDSLLTGGSWSSSVTDRNPEWSDVPLEVIPNPVGAVASITFALEHPSQITLAAFDVQGRRVTTLVKGPMGTGTYTRTWSRRDDRGRDLRPGVYFLCLIMGDSARASKMVVLR
jgi:hypothetical protein